MNSSWDEKLPAGLRFMLTKTTKGRIGLIIGQHKFRKAGAQKDGSLVFRWILGFWNCRVIRASKSLHIFFAFNRCSLKDCPARVNLDAAMRRVLRIRSVHTHPGRDLSDIITARLPSGLISSDGQVVCVSLSWVLLKAFEEIYIVPGCMRRYSMGFLYILFQDQEDKIGRKSQGSKRYSYVLCAIHC